MLSICAVISGADGWEAIEQFGNDKEEWLRKWIALENVIPSHDCIAHVISRIKPSEMTDCFIAWVNGVAELTEGEVVAIDGRMARRHSHGKCLGKSTGYVFRAGKNRRKIKRNYCDTRVT